MSRFDDEVLAALRKVGPNAFPSTVYIEAGDLDAGIFGPSLGSVMSSLVRLTREGLADETSVFDEEGRPRRAFTATSGRRREVGFESSTPAFAFA